MPWCPNCKYEYVDGIEICSDCGAPLADSPPSEPEPVDLGEPVLLVSAGDEFEANMLERLIKQEGIPVMRRYQGAGEYLKVYMGDTRFGIDLYVPASLHEKAVELLKIEEIEEDAPLSTAETSPADGMEEIGDDPYNDELQPLDDEESDAVLLKFEQRVRTGMIFLAPIALFLVLVLIWYLLDRL